MGAMAIAYTWSLRLLSSPQNAPRATMKDDTGFHNACEDKTCQQARTRATEQTTCNNLPKEATRCVSMLLPETAKSSCALDIISRLQGIEEQVRRHQVETTRQIPNPEPMKNIP